MTDTEQIIKILNSLETSERRVIFDYLMNEFYQANKPGPKSTKTRDAYNAITYEPQDFQELRERFGVSEVVLRQFSRFDPYPERGRVRTQMVAGKRLIWRDKLSQKVIRLYASIFSNDRDVLEELSKDITKHVKNRAFSRPERNIHRSLRTWAVASC